MKQEKLIILLSGLIIASMTFSVNASAYLDPSAVTFTIQIGVGVIVAAGAAVGIILTKIKKKAKEKLGIDMEKKKTVEDDVVEFTETDDENNEKTDN